MTSFSGVKRPGREADHSPPSSAEVKNEWSYASILPVCLRGLYRDDFTLPLILNSGNLKTDRYRKVFAVFLSAAQTVGV